MDYHTFRGFLLKALYHDKEVQDKITDVVKTAQRAPQNHSELKKPVYHQDSLQEGLNLEEENRRLEGVLKETLDEVRNLKGIREQLEKEVNALKSENATLEQEKQRLEQEKHSVQEMNYHLEQERNRVQEDNHSLKGQVEQLKGECNRLEHAQSMLEEEKHTLAEDKRKVATELKGYQADFGLIRQHYADYMKLDESIRHDLKRVIQADHIMSFYSSGIQWENIEALWEWLSYQLDTLALGNREILIRTFYYFFEQYNHAMEDYELLEVHTGESFDEELHTRASQSNVAGAISEILLKGYKRKRTQKLTKKTIVRV